jgi:hypothetical protein
LLWSRNDGGGGGCAAIVVAAQQWRRSDGVQRWGAAMGRSDGREGGGAAMAMTAQRWLRRCSNGNGDGGAVMGVVAVAVVHRPPLFACGCSSAAPDGTPYSLVTCCTSAAPHRLIRCPPLFVTDVRMYFPILHIFNVGTPYTQTDTRRRLNLFRYRLNYLNTY